MTFCILCLFMERNPRILSFVSCLFSIKLGTSYEIYARAMTCNKGWFLITMKFQVLYSLNHIFGGVCYLRVALNAVKFCIELDILTKWNLRFSKWNSYWSNLSKYTVKYTWNILIFTCCIVTFIWSATIFTLCILNFIWCRKIRKR